MCMQELENYLHYNFIDVSNEIYLQVFSENTNKNKNNKFKRLRRLLKYLMQMTNAL